ncbi:hypothetical protein AYO08_06100 [Pseudomonas putida]|uniref:hypothetical protein n=1 Tax=Pseudomonas putida TaxID=303 RepID=UPI0007DBF96B|nr:hypothetical protein [Pseudomonas putida]OAS12309.1 hypothetical protein AYO08_06100 [Pseudomonas putida]
MDEEFKNRLEERWLDHQVALSRTIAPLKADPANRYAVLKAWAVFVAKIALHSLVGSAAFLLAVYVAVAYSYGWVPSSVELVLQTWTVVALMGAPIPLLALSAPVRYWETRAAEVVRETDLPSTHRTF